MPPTGVLKHGPDCEWQAGGRVGGISTKGVAIWPGLLGTTGLPPPRSPDRISAGAGGEDGRIEGVGVWLPAPALDAFRIDITCADCPDELQGLPGRTEQCPRKSHGSLARAYRLLEHLLARVEGDLRARQPAEYRRCRRNANGQVIARNVVHAVDHDICFLPHRERACIAMEGVQSCERMLRYHDLRQCRVQRTKVKGRVQGGGGAADGPMKLVELRWCCRQRDGASTARHYEPSGTP